MKKNHRQVGYTNCFSPNFVGKCVLFSINNRPLVFCILKRNWPHSYASNKFKINGQFLNLYMCLPNSFRRLKRMKGRSGVSLNGTILPWFDTFWSQSWLVYFSAAGVVCSSRCGGKTMYSRKELSQHLLIDLGADDQKHAGEPRI